MTRHLSRVPQQPIYHLFHSPVSFESDSTVMSVDFSPQNVREMHATTSTTAIKTLMPLYKMQRLWRAPSRVQAQTLPNLVILSLIVSLDAKVRVMFPIVFSGDALTMKL